jgi:hypothetical protein
LHVSGDDVRSSYDPSLATVPSVFNLPPLRGQDMHRARAGSGAAPPATAPAASASSGDDLLGLFDVFSPTSAAPAPVLPPAGADRFPFQSPARPPASAPSSAGSDLAGLATAVHWRVRLEVRFESDSSLQAFAAGAAGWFAEFCGGALTLVRHFGVAPVANCAADWRGVCPADGKVPGLASMCGVGEQSYQPPLAVLHTPPPNKRQDSGLSSFFRGAGGASEGGAGSLAAMASPSIEALFPGFTVRLPPPQ